MSVFVHCSLFILEYALLFFLFYLKTSSLNSIIMVQLTRMTICLYTYFFGSIFIHSCLQCSENMRSFRFVNDGIFIVWLTTNDRKTFRVHLFNEKQNNSKIYCLCERAILSPCKRISYYLEQLTLDSYFRLDLYRFSDGRFFNPESFIGI